MNIELVVFDIAGTTVKDHGEIALSFQKALQEFGYRVPLEKIDPLMGYKKTGAIEMMLDEYEPDSARITMNRIDQIHEQFIALMVDYYRNTNELQPLPHAEEVFDWLKQRGVRIALDTGFFNNITDVIIDRIGWLKNQQVDMVVSSNEVSDGRPFPYMIQKIMEAVGVNDPQKIIKVGDTEVDIREGKNAGCRYSIGVTTEGFSREQLLYYQPDFIIDDLEQLIPIIEQA